MLKTTAVRRVRDHVALLVAAALVLTWTAAWTLSRGTPAADAVVAVGLPVAVACAVGAGLLSLRWRTGADRWAWALICAGVLTWGTNAVLIDWRSWSAELVVSDGASRLGWVLLVTTVATGTAAFALLLSRSNTTSGVLRDALDSALLTAVGCSVVWHLSLSPSAATSGVHASAPAVVAVTAELLVAAVAIHTGVRTRGRDPRLVTVCAAAATLVLGDVGAAVTVLRGDPRWDDVTAWAWLTSMALMAAAAGHRPGRDGAAAVDDRPVLSGGALPCAAALLALASAAPAAVSGQQAGPASSWLHVTVLTLLLVRCLLLAHDGDRLTRGLGARITERTRQVASEERRFASLVVHGSDLVLVVDGAGAVTYASPSAERTTGIPGEALVGRPVTDVLTVEDPAALARVLRTVAAGGPPRHLRLSVRHTTGRTLTLDTTLTGLVEHDAVQGTVVNAHDVTEAVRLAEELSRQAFSDALTGLPNRALFKDRLEHALRSRGSRSEVQVCYLDLDGFKAVNDTLGHGAGDELLVLVAERLLAAVRQGDTVARMGGDEFAVLLDETSGEQDAERLAQRVCDAVRRPFTVRDVEVSIATSIGLASTATAGRDAEQLMRSADLAMYQAKAARQGGYALYHPQMHDQLLHRVQLEADLRRVVAEGQFRVVYQPLVDMGDGGVSGVEALVRWDHPERGVVSPASFIPLAESTGLIDAIGAFVLREACGQVATWRAEVPGAETMRLSVNLSGHQLEDPHLVGAVVAVLDETGMPATSLVLEVTESLLVDQDDTTLATLNALRALGVRLAIDDFGTGYSSLSYLHRLPVDILKIDKSFVDRLTADGDLSLVDAILSMAAMLDLTTVAEGVEHEHQRAALAAQGCTTGQGYHFSPPVDARDLPGLVTGALAATPGPGPRAADPAGATSPTGTEVAR
ncbi:EAL domain-containing protein [Quadrisphaera sp. INWT6]|nr:EAL domain-containing protein [Quadrisphaera sp. INWT6]